MLIGAAFFALAPFFFLLVTALTKTYTQQVKLSEIAHPTGANFTAIFSRQVRAVDLQQLHRRATHHRAGARDRLARRVRIREEAVRGRDMIFFMLLVTLMIPIPVTILPTFLLATRLGMIESTTR